MAKIKIRGEGGILAKLGKRNLIIIVAVLLIGVAVAVNYFVFYGSDGTVDYGSSNMGDPDTDAGANASDPKDTYFSSAVLSPQSESASMVDQHGLPANPLSFPTQRTST